jgi:hypothetical protein
MAISALSLSILKAPCGIMSLEKKSTQGAITMDFSFLKNLEINRWWKMILLLSVVVLIIALVFDVKILDNTTLALLSLSGIFISLGFFASEKIKVTQEPDFTGQKIDIFSEPVFAWKASGVVLFIIGFIFLIIGFTRIF